MFCRQTTASSWMLAKKVHVALQGLMNKYNYFCNWGTTDKP